ncbi:unnamed protein product [Lymnaea stagnalis]|uniref:CARD domain-containing protein n=1 Tax=Lymnaea stagnalis TaxID=6523 RepID=A0AAV2I0M9_LYMST
MDRERSARPSLKREMTDVDDDALRSKLRSNNSGIIKVRDTTHDIEHPTKMPEYRPRRPDTRTHIISLRTPNNVATDRAQSPDRISTHSNDDVKSIDYHSNSPEHDTKSQDGDTKSIDYQTKTPEVQRRSPEWRKRSPPVDDLDRQDTFKSKSDFPVPRRSKSPNPAVHKEDLSAFDTTFGPYSYMKSSGSNDIPDTKNSLPHTEDITRTLTRGDIDTDNFKTEGTKDKDYGQGEGGLTRTDLDTRHTEISRKDSKKSEKTKYIDSTKETHREKNELEKYDYQNRDVDSHARRNDGQSKSPDSHARVERFGSASTEVKHETESEDKYKSFSRSESRDKIGSNWWDDTNEDRRDSSKTNESKTRNSITGSESVLRDVSKSKNGNSHSRLNNLSRRQMSTVHRRATSLGKHKSSTRMSRSKTIRRHLSRASMTYYHGDIVDDNLLISATKLDSTLLRLFSHARDAKKSKDVQEPEDKLMPYLNYTESDLISMEPVLWRVFPMDSAHKETLEMEMPYIENNIEPRDVIRTLYQGEIITHMDYNQFARTEGQGERAVTRLLVKTLQRRGDKAYPAFLGALKTHDYMEVHDKLVETESKISQGMMADGRAMSRGWELNNRKATPLGKRIVTPVIVLHTSRTNNNNEEEPNPLSHFENLVKLRSQTQEQDPSGADVMDPKDLEQHLRELSKELQALQDDVTALKSSRSPSVNTAKSADISRNVTRAPSPSPDRGDIQVDPRAKSQKSSSCVVL